MSSWRNDFEASKILNAFVLRHALDRHGRAIK